MKLLKPRFEKFKKNYDEAIETIDSLLKGPESMKELANWLVDTNHNPYGFLPEAYAAVFDSAEGFASLLSDIHHAVEDDGDICFMTIGGVPSIRFICKYSDNLKEKVVSKERLRIEDGIEKAFASLEGFPNEEMKKVPYIEILNIKPNEFGAIYDQYEKEEEERRKKWESLMLNLRDN